jgi:hypothetical protein
MQRVVPLLFQGTLKSCAAQAAYTQRAALRENRSALAMPEFFYQPTVYQFFHSRFIHEILHFFSGFAGCFFGCWAYAAFARWRAR